MSSCPVCEFLLRGEETACPQCSWDLKPDPLTLGQIPNEFKAKYVANLIWARAMWERSLLTDQLQLEIEQLSKEKSALQTQLEQILPKFQQETVNHLIDRFDHLENLVKQLQKGQQNLQPQVETYNKELEQLRTQLPNVTTIGENLQLQLQSANRERQHFQLQLQSEISHRQKLELKLQEALHRLAQIESQIKPVIEVQLKSAVGVNYTKLENLLAEGKWQEADQETTRKMLEVTGREKEGYLTANDIENFPCEDLKTIDKLWLKYSNSRFGFSVQKNIYQSLGGKREYNQNIWNRFADRVEWTINGDWINYSDLEFEAQAPPGHLPRGQVSGVLIGFGWVGEAGWFASLTWRCVECGL